MQPYKYKPLNTDESELRLISLLPSTNVDDVISFSIFHAPFPCKYDPKAEDKNTKGFLSRVNAGLKLGWTALGLSNGRIVYLNEGKGLLQFEHPGARPALLRRHRHAIYALGVDAKIPSSVGLGVPQFEALSYVWGSADTPVAVHVLGDDEPLTTATKPGFSLTVGQNLAQALRHLRRENDPRILWIDAICINQEDLQERAAQVPRMGAIYRYAAGVVVWLGPSSPTSSQALRDLTDFGRFHLMTLDSQLIPNPDTHHGGLLVSSMGVPEHWVPAILDLLAMPWFCRLWTLQEARLGASRAVLQCGYDRIPWESLTHAVSRIWNDRDEDGLRYPTRYIDQLRRTVFMCQAYYSTKTLMSASRIRECSDPRDKIYGVSSLLLPEISEQIAVDYNIPLQQLYQDIFIAYLKTTSRLDLMMSAGLGNQAPGMASWMPAWTGEFNSWELSDAVMFSSSASGYTDTFWSTNQRTSNAMDFVGTRPLRVTWVSERLETLHDMYSLMQTHGGTAMKDNNPETFDVFVHLIYGGSFIDRVQLPGVYESLQSRRVSVLKDLGCYEERGCRQWCWPKHSCNERIEETYKSLSFHSPCRMIRTEDGFLGVCSVAAKVGDCVAILLGCQVPMLLRPVERAGQGHPGLHELVGMCHIPGKMDGQAVLGPIPEPWEPLYTNNRGSTNLVFINNRFGGGNGRRLVARNDPRLSKVPVPKGWKELGPVLEEDIPDYQFDYAYKWKQRRTGRIIRSDPRLLPEELLKRGIELNTYQLI